MTKQDFEALKRAINKPGVHYSPSSIDAHDAVFGDFYVHRVLIDGEPILVSSDDVRSTIIVSRVKQKGGCNDGQECVLIKVNDQGILLDVPSANYIVKQINGILRAIGNEMYRKDI